MGMWSGLVAEDVVEQVSKSLEHMFDSLRTATDGLQDPLQRAPRDRWLYAADPSDDQTSSFVRTRSITALVKS